MNEFLRLKYFVKYQWRAKTKYYLHSPFVYQFYLNVLEGSEDPALKAIHTLRKKLGNDHTEIAIRDFGMGKFSSKKISAIESKVAVSEKYGRLLFRLVKYFKPQTILELGTSIGLSSSYIALANEQASIASLEGAPALIEIAEKNYAALNIKNVTTHAGNFNDILLEILKSRATLDLVFFDGNHQKEATLKYFSMCLEKANDKTIFIFDDIHWSKEMHEAWAEIKAHPQITLALDIFQFGICFFRKEKLSKEEFVLRY